ncbi:MAG: hypothetical protein ACFFDH_19880 [Promethearchaeota archaeon]
MTKNIKNFSQVNRNNSFSSYIATQVEEDKNYIVYTIKEDFKNSVAHWQYKKKISKLKKILRNKM